MNLSSNSRALLTLLPAMVLFADFCWILNSLDDLSGPFALRCLALDGRPALLVPPWSAATLFAVAAGTVIAIAVEALRNPPQGSGAASVFFGGLIVTAICGMLDCNLNGYRPQELIFLAEMIVWDLVTAMVFRCSRAR